jgi:hypothetical protein
VIIVDLLESLRVFNSGELFSLLVVEVFHIGLGDLFNVFIFSFQFFCDFGSIPKSKGRLIRLHY